MDVEKAIEEEMVRIWEERGDGQFPSDRQFDELRREAGKAFEELNRTKGGRP